MNLKYILIVVILAAVVGGGILGYQSWLAPKEVSKIPEIKPLEVKTPEEVLSEEVPVDETAKQMVINYLEANINDVVKAKPVLGAPKFFINEIQFYPDNKFIASFEDGHILGYLFGKYILEDDKVRIEYIDETFDLEKLDELKIKYQFPVDKTTNWKTYRNEEFGFEVKYPGNILSFVQITKTLPPDYKTKYSGGKLISAARLDKLGKQECSYGLSGLTSVCEAEKEGGIEFITVNNSFQNLVSSLDSSLKTDVIIAGEQGIKYSIGAEGEGIDYYYIPLSSSQTLVVARLYRFDGFPQSTLFNQVLTTLVIE